LRRRLGVRTLNDAAAINVEVQPVELGDWIARFDAVPLLERSTPQEVHCWVEKAHGLSTTTAIWDLESLISQTAQKAMFVELKVPIFVRYRDSHGRKWESVNELTYDPFVGTGGVTHKFYVLAPS
jgi:hypothetical protein